MVYESLHCLQKIDKRTQEEHWCPRNELLMPKKCCLKHSEDNIWWFQRKYQYVCQEMEAEGEEEN